MSTYIRRHIFDEEQTLSSPIVVAVVIHPLKKKERKKKKEKEKKRREEKKREKKKITMSFQSSCRAGKIASQKSRTSKGGGRNVSANYATKIPQRCHHPPPGSANFYSLDSRRRAPLLIEGFCLVSW